MQINFEEFLLKIREQYLEEIQIIGKESKFRELPGWDSMTGMTLLLMIEEDYKIKIETSTFKQLITINDLYNYITK
jgi:acyl carrier protein